jgi:hypothetical protein
MLCTCFAQRGEERRREEQNAGTEVALSPFFLLLTPLETLYSFLLWRGAHRVGRAGEPFLLCFPFFKEHRPVKRVITFSLFKREREEKHHAKLSKSF